MRFRNFLLFSIQYGNFLFRGGIANYNGEFQYSTLEGEMKTEAKDQGNLTLPDTFYLIDIKYVTFFAYFSRLSPYHIENTLELN